MFKQHNYPVPQGFLQGPLNNSLDFNVMNNSISDISKSEYVAQVSSDLSTLFLVEDPDCSSIMSIQLPSFLLLCLFAPCHCWTSSLPPPPP